MRAPRRFRVQSGNRTHSQNTEPGLLSKEPKSPDGSFTLYVTVIILSVASQLVRKFQSARMHAELEDVQLWAPCI